MESTTTKTTKVSEINILKLRALRVLRGENHTFSLVAALPRSELLGEWKLCITLTSHDWALSVFP